MHTTNINYTTNRIAEASMRESPLSGSPGLFTIVLFPWMCINVQTDEFSTPGTKWHAMNGFRFEGCANLFSPSKHGPSTCRQFCDGELLALALQPVGNCDL